ncbi:TPA: hypothetical protein ACKREO_002528 [Providencia stuartii]
MKYRKEIDGDYTFGLNQHLVDTPEAVAQAVKSRLSLWLGEWFLNDQEGTPHYQKGLGKHVAQGYALAIKSRILETEGVTKLTAFNLDLNTAARKIIITATIDTVYGEASIVSEG